MIMAHMIDVYNPGDGPLLINGVLVPGKSHAVTAATDQVTALEEMGLIVVHTSGSDDPDVVERLVEAKAEVAEAKAEAKAEAAEAKAEVATPKTNPPKGS